MRLEGKSKADGRLSAVTIHLTNSEASELRDALQDLLDSDHNGWHAHVSSADYETEIALARQE